jgi:hypothetical protein
LPTSAAIGGAQRGFSLRRKRSIFADGRNDVAYAGSGGFRKRKEADDMAIQSHLAELQKRHQALEQEINEALTHPSTDDLTIAELKRRKLLVKDEITRLRQNVSVH